MTFKEQIDMLKMCGVINQESKNVEKDLEKLMNMDIEVETLLDTYLKVKKFSFGSFVRILNVIVTNFNEDKKYLYYLDKVSKLIRIFDENVGDTGVLYVINTLIYTTSIYMSEETMRMALKRSKYFRINGNGALGHIQSLQVKNVKYDIEIDEDYESFKIKDLGIEKSNVLRLENGKWIGEYYKNGDDADVIKDMLENKEVEIILHLANDLSKYILDDYLYHEREVGVI